MTARSQLLGILIALSPVMVGICRMRGMGFLKQANQIRSKVSLVGFFLEHLSPSAVTR